MFPQHSVPITNALTAYTLPATVTDTLSALNHLDEGGAGAEGGMTAAFGDLSSGLTGHSSTPPSSSTEAGGLATSVAVAMATTGLAPSEQPTAAAFGGGSMNSPSDLVQSMSNNNDDIGEDIGWGDTISLSSSNKTNKNQSKTNRHSIETCIKEERRKSLDNNKVNSLKKCDDNNKLSLNKKRKSVEKIATPRSNHASEDEAEDAVHVYGGAQTSSRSAVSSSPSSLASSSAHVTAATTTSTEPPHLKKRRQEGGKDSSSSRGNKSDASSSNSNKEGKGKGSTVDRGSSKKKKSKKGGGGVGIGGDIADDIDDIFGSLPF